MKVTRQEEVVEVKKVVIEPETFTLVLTRTEVEVLAIIMAMVGGAPDTTPRAITDKLGRELAASGLNYMNVRWASDGLNIRHDVVGGSITVKSGPTE